MRSNKPIGKRNGLRIYKPLRAKTPLKSRKPINRQSEKQKAKNEVWKLVTELKARKLNFICQWCGLAGKLESYNRLTGHHIQKRSKGRIDTIENCYVSHWITCHDFIETHGIDVRKYPNKETWLNKNRRT